MPDRRTNPPRIPRLALVLGPIWLGVLLASAPSWAEQQAARLRVPGIDAACRADAEQRARATMRLKSVEWLAGPAAPGAAQGDAPAMRRVEIAGRARSAGGWLRLTANCTYAEGRPAAILVDAQPAPALDLSGIARLPEPPKRQEANAQTSPSSSPGAASPEAGPSAHLKPSLTEVPFDPLMIGKRQDFLKDHLLGIKLQTPF